MCITRIGVRCPYIATLEYLINVYDQLSVYGRNLGLDTHRVGI